MTEEEKKEFEEFLQWKAEKAKKEALEKTEVPKEELKEEPKIENSPNNIPQEQVNGINIAIVAVVAFVVLIMLFFVLRSCNTNRMQAPQDEVIGEYEDSIAEVDVVEANPEPSIKEWDFSIEKDAMTDTKNIWATIRSDNYISQDFPYEGCTYASITVRYMKKYGYDVLIQISKGQINGRSYYGTDYITARFDDGTSKKYYFNEAADGSSETVFLRNQSDFIKKCKAAKDIKIDIPIYKEGRPVFLFHVDEPLVWREE